MTPEQLAVGSPAARNADTAWADAALAAALFAVAPCATGVRLRAPPGPARERWLQALRSMLPPGTPLRRVPLHVTDGRLLGGLDLAATLGAGRPVAERGLLAEADGGLAILAMAERLPVSAVARLTAAMDAGQVAVERDGMALRHAARFGVLALDEGDNVDEQPAAALLDRLAFHLELAAARPGDAAPQWHRAAEILAARERLPCVQADAATVEALCVAAGALGIDSIRAVQLALNAARAAAALAGRMKVQTADAVAAGRLVLARRATRLPQAGPEPGVEQDRPVEESEPAAAEASPPESSAAQHPSEQAAGPVQGPALDDLVLAAAKAAIPPGLLEQLKLAAAGGRPAPARRGELRGGVRLDVLETLRAAAPWQRLRRTAAPLPAAAGAAARIQVRREDFHVSRSLRRSETTTIFVVDASGSSALNRLAEAKGAVELLLADCYVRRDRVAVLAFRGCGAELLLPPTRSLVRARRGLAGLPGGGGTPLAAAIDAAVALAAAVQRRGGTPSIVLLTDGNGNVARDGRGGRRQAEEDALAAARELRAAGPGALFVDTAPYPQPQAERLAAEMGAVYLPLPYADARAVSQAVRATQAAAGSRR